MSTQSGGSLSALNWIDMVEVAARKNSWAAVLERSLVQITNKNVLEVVLEKDFTDSFVVSQLECAKFLSKFGLDMNPNGPIH